MSDVTILHAKGYPELEGAEIDELNLEALSLNILMAKLEDNPPPWELFKQGTWLGQLMYDANEKLLWLISQLAWIGVKPIEDYRPISTGDVSYLDEWFKQFGWFRDSWLELFDSAHGPFAPSYKQWAKYGSYCWPPGE